MTAVDTNLVVRLLTQDDRKQAAIASTVFATEEVWIAKSVLLETAWVLETVYGFDATAIRRALLLLLGLPNVRIEDEEAVARAIDLIAKGLDFADALHLVSRPAGAWFISFDKALVRRAQRAGIEGLKAP
ncbi:MAG TPA: type II toxin-antitoxin system VapC family toxin [Bryobacteraceae bacterium]